MFDKARILTSYTLNGLDGAIGSVKEFYFDDQHWAIRYLVADTGTWLTERQVLISPYALGVVDHAARQIAVRLTRQQIEDSPSVGTDIPVSRQFQDAYFGFFGWPMYWTGPYMWGSYPYIARDHDPATRAGTSAHAWDPHLRSTRDVDGHHLQATDGEIGHVEDFIIDEESWAIRYLVVATRNWWPGKKVLVSPHWIERVSWDESKVFVALSRETIQAAPEYSDALLLDRDYETRLHRHYDRQGYWVDELAAAADTR
jgi:hypothetical protein